jgi:predicted AlkP superfamily phosphohydrolase/phosphomutase
MVQGRLLSGMGVPDLCGGLGISTFFTTAANVHQEESERVVQLRANGTTKIESELPGPRHPRTGKQATFAFSLQLAGDSFLLLSEGEPGELTLRPGEWSPWLFVTFKLGLLNAQPGMVRFFLVKVHPEIELYASPINFTPDSPPFPISSPPGYAAELAKTIGPYYTTGMVEDHNGLNNGRFGEATFLDQCEQVVREREQMMLHELERHWEGLFFCLFDTPDRIQHMFWRFREQDHPANRNGHHSREREGADFSHVIEEHYRRCDSIVGKALEYADDQTLVIVLSDHGFNSFQRAVHLNTWLFDNGYLALSGKVRPGEEVRQFFHGVDWPNTKAYALGLSGIYLNLKGREGAGIVQSEHAVALKNDLIARLTGLTDPVRGATAIRSVVAREQVYSGPYAAESPDLIINYSPGYRVSWATALGGLPAGHFEDNVKKWSGDHIIDPGLVPGVLFMNRPFDHQDAHLVDLAPTILAGLGVPKPAEMEGESILR